MMDGEGGSEAVDDHRMRVRMVRGREERGWGEGGGMNVGKVEGEGGAGGEGWG